MRKPGLINQLSLLAMVVVLAACGDEGTSRSPALNTALEEGRRAWHPESHRQDNLALQSGAVVRMELADADGRPLRLFFDTTRMPPLSIGELEAALFAGIAAVDGAFPGAAAFQPAANYQVRHGNGMLSLNYLRRWEGLPVEGAFLEGVFFADDQGKFRLGAIHNRSGGFLQPLNSEDDTHNPASLRRLTGLTTALLLEQRDVILPGDDGPLLVSEFTVEDPANGEALTIRLENGADRIVQAWSHRSHAFQVKASVYEKDWKDGVRNPHILPLIEYSVGNQKGAADLDGFIFRDGDEAPSQSKGTLTVTSERARIFNQRQGNRYKVPFELVGEEIVLDTDGSHLKGLNSFTTVSRINAYARHFLSPDEVKFLDSGVTVIADAGGNCNAYYDTRGNSLNLLSEGRGCSAIALVNDVIMHEWGHGLDSHTGRRSGITDGAFSEGLSDVVATFYMGQSKLGEAFMMTGGGGVRDVNNRARYPENRGEVHREGQIIAGAFWTMRKALIERYGKTRGAYEAGLLFFRHLLTTDSYRNSYDTVLLLNDDDANPGTPSPDHCLITAAFARHGLARDEGCTDDVADLLPVDESLTTAIHSRDAGAIRLMASTTAAGQMAYCVGTRRACDPEGNDAGLVEMSPGGEANGRRFFLAPEPRRIPVMAEIHFFLLDENGKARVGRSHKLVTK